MKKTILICGIFLFTGCYYPESEYDIQKSKERDETRNRARQELADANSLQDYLNLTHYTWSSYLLNYDERFIYKDELDDLRRAWYISNSNLHPQMQELIAHGKITLGMTQEQVLASWGRPYTVNKDVYTFGIHEQWVYGSDSSRPYLYFEDGKLTSWQD